MIQSKNYSCNCEVYAKYGNKKPKIHYKSKEYWRKLYNKKNVFCHYEYISDICTFIFYIYLMFIFEIY